MTTLNTFLLFCILSLVFCRFDVMKCGDEVIENFHKCGTGDKKILVLNVKINISLFSMIYFAYLVMIHYMAKSDVAVTVMQLII